MASNTREKKVKKLIREAKTAKGKAKLAKGSMRLVLPPHKVHKTKKDYKRNNKVKVHEAEKD